MSLDMSQLVVKDNALINASYRLSSNEMHLILLAIAMGREQEKGFEPDKMLEIRADTFAQYRGIERHTAYEALKEASKSFFTAMSLGLQRTQEQAMRLSCKSTG